MKETEIKMNPTRCQNFPPYWKHHVNSHMQYNEKTRITTMTLYTKDHQKVITLSDAEFVDLPTQSEQLNWAYNQRQIFLKSLKILYTGVDP